MEERNKLLNEINALREQLVLLEEETDFMTLEERESIRNMIRQKEQKIKEITEEQKEGEDVIMENDNINISEETKLSKSLEALKARLELLEEENDFMTLEERESIRSTIRGIQQKMKAIELEANKEEPHKEEVIENKAIIEEKVFADEIIKNNNLEITEKEKLSNTVKALNAQLELLEKENDFTTLEERESIRWEIEQTERRIKELEQTVEEENKEQNKLELSQEEKAETQKIEKQQKDVRELSETIEELRKLQNQLELSEAKVMKTSPEQKQNITKSTQEEQGHANIKEFSETVEERYRMQNQAELSEAEFPRIEEMRKRAAKTLEEKKKRQQEIEELTRKAKESLEAIEQGTDIIDVEGVEIFDAQTQKIEDKTEMKNNEEREKNEEHVIDLTNDMINGQKTTDIPEEIIDLTDMIRDQKTTSIPEEEKGKIIDLTDVIPQNKRELEKVQKQGLMSLLIGLIAKIANKCKSMFKKKPKELMEAMGIKETDRTTIERKFRDENRLEVSQVSIKETSNNIRDKAEEREER